MTLLYPLRSNLGDFQYLYIDLFIILPVAVFMGYSEASDTIHPKNPTSNLLSKKVLTSLGGQALLMGLFQVLVFIWIRSRPYYKPPELAALGPHEEDEDDDSIIVCFENSVLFLLSNFQYVLVGFIAFWMPFAAILLSNLFFTGSSGIFYRAAV